MSYERYYLSQNQPSSSNPNPNPTPTIIPESSSVNMEISVEDLVSQEGRGLLTRLHPDRSVANTKWFTQSESKITKVFLNIMNTLLTQPYEKYAHIPVEERERWFRLFAQQFTWDRELTFEVRNEFHASFARYFSKRLNEWKKKWTSGECPKNVAESLMRAYEPYWAREDVVALSTTNSQNRKSNRKGKGMAVHSGGSMSAETRADLIYEKEGVYPDPLRVMEEMYTNKQTGVIQDVVARDVIQSTKKRKDDYLLTQQSGDGSSSASSIPPEVVTEYLIQETPKTKGRHFGFGTLAKSIRKIAGGRPSSSSQPTPSPQLGEMQQSLQAKDAEILALQNRMVSMEKVAEDRQREVQETLMKRQLDMQETLRTERAVLDAQMKAFMDSMKEEMEAYKTGKK